MDKKMKAEEKRERRLERKRRAANGESESSPTVPDQTTDADPDTV